MEPIRTQLTQLRESVEAAWQQLHFAALSDEQRQLAEAISAPDFWQDPVQAATVSQREAALRSRLEPWQRLRQGIAEMLELLATDDETLLPEITAQASGLALQFAQLRGELLFSGPYDAEDAVLTLHAGAGGTDAQDWAAMLERMYIRWAEQQGMRVTILDESPAEEAGIKSVTLLITGALAYGKLKSEQGVHRLVRLSPFNSDNLRQTSFAKVELVPKLNETALPELDEKDLRIDVYRAGGHGGQSVNTTDSAVRVTHVPTGQVVAIQNERSQLQNKEMALAILRAKLLALQQEQHAEKISELKGPNEQAAWGNQIRSYVLHPYKQVKDLRTRYETSDIDGVLAGNLDPFIEAFLDYTMQAN